MSIPAAAALLAIGLLVAWAATRVAAGYGRGDPRLTWLSAREQAVVAAAADATFPPGGAIPLSGVEAGVVAYADRYLGALPRRNRVLIRLLLAFFEHATLLFPAPGWSGRRRYSALSLPQRMTVLEAYARSRLVPRRVVFQSLRAILTMGYFAHPAVLRATGLAPLAMETPVVDADLLFPPVGRPRSAIRFDPADRTPAAVLPPLDPHGPLHPAYAEPPR